jgi:Zn finger protein HypA/HybF involved in hydrogenase expression
VSDELSMKSIDERSANALAALDRLIGWARGDHYCKRCKGEGELSPTEDDYMPCPDCDGTGEVEVDA